MAKNHSISQRGSDDYDGPLPDSMMIAMRQGDEAAWERFGNEGIESIRRWFIGEGLQPKDAEDLSQDIALQVIQKIDKCRFNFHYWVLKHARWKLSSYGKKRNPEIPLDEQLVGSLTIAAPQKPNSPQWTNLRALISKLPEQDQKVLRLRFDTQLKGKAFAEELGIEEDAARQRLQRALIKLRDLLQGALSALSDSDRTLILLRYFKQMESNAIAKELGITEAAVAGGCALRWPIIASC